MTVFELIMAPRRKLTVEERIKIVYEYEKIKNFSAVGKLFKVSPEGVRKIIKKSLECPSLADRPRSGRPRATTSVDDRLIVRQCKINPKIVVREIKDQLQEAGTSVSETTIRRRLHDANLRGHIARKKPLLTSIHKKRRLEFARKYSDKPIEFWKRVVFSDESKFELFGNRRRQTVWRTSNDNSYDDKYLQPTVKHGGGSVMVWGCFSWHGVGRLQVIEGKMTAQVYCNILRDNLKQSAETMGLGRIFKFQQDNDPKHTARITKQYFEDNEVDLLEWPSMSPDLNPIEHLWDELDRRIPVSIRRNRNLFKNKILETWSIIPVETLQNLVESMPRRLKAVLQNNGGHTKY